MKTPILMLVFMTLGVPCSLLAQGTLRGTVVDSVTHERLVGVNVLLVGTALGGATDREGQYKVVRIPSGDFTARASCIGYRTKEVRVSIGGGDTTVNFELFPSVVLGEEVVVTAQVRGQIAAINQQISSNTIVNVISEEKIKELPDANAAEALGRLPGVSIIRSGGEANKVILRGMSDKFTSIMIDGIRFAATDANERGVDLSTVSQEALAGIEVYKSLTPDQDAEAIAGRINLVTKKAPSERLLRLDSKDVYGRLNRNFGQYNFSLRYGERFFDDVLGVQLGGNLESRDRSNEVVNTAYDVRENAVYHNLTSYTVRSFDLQYTDETRGRGGFSVLLDANTPDDGNIRLNNIFNKTNRDYTIYDRSYTGGNDNPVYGARDVERDIRTFISSLQGENHLVGIDATWGGSFAESFTEDPYDFQLLFHEPSSDSSGMRGSPEVTGSPEQLIPYAWNNFPATVLDTAFFRYEKNRERQQTAHLDLKRNYTFSDLISGEAKIGGKYGSKHRTREASTLGGAYWLSRWSKTEMLPDGTLQPKALAGTRFANMLNQTDAVVSMAYFLNYPPPGRDVYDRFALYPLINRDALRQWYDLNKNGATGVVHEYEHSVENDLDYYVVDERVSAGYVMNTLNVGQWMTLIAGVRVEAENNDYASKYTPSYLTSFPLSGGPVRDTTMTYRETVWLPSIQTTLRPTDFMNVRLAAYRSLARPDFNNRLVKSLAVKANRSDLTVGNSNLRDAKAWNYEVNTSFFGNEIGLVSVSAFYKQIEDMFHQYNQMKTKGSQLLKSLGIPWNNPFDTSSTSSFLYYLTYPYNSARPTKVWGLEFEHQANLNFLPGFLHNVVLGYNFSVIRSETFQTFYVDRTDSFYVESEFGNYWQKFDTVDIFEGKTRLENQPEFFFNVALGYDVGGFSGRVSLFHQGEYTSIFTARSRGDRVVGAYSRLDLSLKQRISDNISLLLNLNNLTNTEEPASDVYADTGWDLPRTSQKYGMSGDFGVRIEW